MACDSYPVGKNKQNECLEIEVNPNYNESMLQQ